MLWVTRDFVHLDRVASPWLIRRFVDPQAEFVFVPWGQEHERPPQAIAFGMPGVELGSHDEAGSTFQKILKKYQLDDVALLRLGQVIKLGVDHVMHDYRPGPQDTDGQIAVGLLAISEGILFNQSTDLQIIEASFPVYDALYANFKVHATLHEQGFKPPPPTRPGPGEKFQFLRGVLKAAET